MKSLIYKQLTTILRILIVTAMLFGQNGIVVKAQGSIHNDSITNFPLATSQRWNTPKSKITATTYSHHKLPWKGGERHQVTTAATEHSASAEYWAYDFVMPEGTEVWSSYSGRVVYVVEQYGPGSCTTDPNKGNRVVVFNDDGSASLYLHLKKDGSNVSVGQRVKQGDLIGWSGNSGESCGVNGGYHLHFQVEQQEYYDVARTKPKWYTPSQRVIFDPNGEPSKDSSPVSSNYRCPSPSPDKIILYREPEFGCGSKGENIGYKVYDNLADGQFLQVPSTLEASSISIPNGWYVYLKNTKGRPNDVYTATALRCESDKSFIDDTFLTIHVLNDILRTIHIHRDFLDNRVDTIEVRKGSCTDGNPPNRPPNIPVYKLSLINLNSPTSLTTLAENGTSANTNIAPSLNWENGGDLDGDEIQFYVEVNGDNQTINSGWIDNTIWRPSMLDYQYGGYQWHVKARDGRGAESDWSETWSFSIQSPNKPPSISFSSANGDAFPGGVIYSRTSNWTFTGSASDPEGQLNRVEWRCSGDNCGSQAGQSGAGSWSYTRNGMTGRNDIYFMAYDGYGNNTPSRHLDLRIDQAAPTTTASLNGQSSAAQWPGWFTAAVKVSLHGADNGTGHALVGMGKIHYRLDGGAWQVVSASDTVFTVSADGGHTVTYYSEDALGNTEGTRSFSFQIDQTPPSLPANLQETHGLVSNQWQKTQNAPAFTWDAASDATSGLRGYQVYFGDDPNGVGYKNITAAETRQWTPFPAGLPTGTSYLRIRTQDNAGNWSTWATLFTFRYDGTPPENPADVNHAAGISTAWQNTTSQANFSWQVAHDEGSGIQGYYIYWGMQADGTSTTLVNAKAYQNLMPLCAINATCTGYLRVRSLDNVGNLAEDWNTVFILRYDNVPPVVDFTFNGGATQMAQSQVTLNVSASDLGSGVFAARFSADGQNWTDWEQPAAERLWNIPAISRQSWPVFAQVQDHVGLLSPIMQHEIYLDVNPAQPSSLGYRLFDYGINGGSGRYTSTSYSGRGTLGPVADAPLTSSAHYSLSNGYEAGSQAVPLIVPGHDSFTFLTGAFISGTVASPLQSASYQMLLAVGGIGLPASTTISSASYQHQPGFLAGVQPSAPVTPPGAVPQPTVPAPQADPLLACDTPSVSINAGAVYTDSPSVSLNLCAPYAAEMMLSSQDDFAGAQWEPFAATRAWVIPTDGSSVDPHFVYFQFKDAGGNTHATYFDDILYDTNQPSGALLLTDNISAPAAQSMSAMGVDSPSVQGPFNGNVTLYVDGSDDNSGMAEMQISADPTFAGAEWKPFSPLAQITPDGEDGVKTYYARFRDAAGNLSGTTTLSFIYDTQPPVGYIFADPAVLPGDAVTTTLHLGTYDPASEGDETVATTSSDAVEMRLGSDPTLQDAYWQPLTDTVTVAIDPTQPEGTYYVQYHDAAGNLSEITSATWQVDTLAPDLSAVAEPGTGLSRTVNIYASDNLAGIANLYLSNDPLIQDSVTTLPYTDTLTWTFDDRKVVWIVAEDGVGNRSDPYPVYATELVDPPVITPTPTVTATPTSTPTPPAIDSISYNIAYQGWSGKKDVKASGGGYRMGNVSGQTISYTATGNSTSISLITYKGPDQGKVQILVDGISKGVFDLYSAAPTYKYAITISKLASKKHTVMIKLLHQKNALSKGYWVRVDAVKIGSTAIDDGNLAVKYSSWGGASQAGTYNGSYRSSSVAGANATFTITGAQFTLVTARGPKYGIVDVYVDNILFATYDLYNPAQEWQYNLVISGLSNAAHTIRVQVKGTHNPVSMANTVVLDAVIDP